MNDYEAGLIAINVSIGRNLYYWETRVTVL